MRLCPRCGHKRRLDSFYRRSNGKVFGYCKPCAKEATNEWRRSNRPAVQRMARRASLKRYGLTQSDYERLLKSQRGVCAICARAPSEGRWLHVDHDHATSQIRGLLCIDCNLGVGRFGDDPSRLRRAARYVTRG